MLDEKLYCDITFVIDDKDFLAHVAILSARAPAFSQKFLPQLLAPTEVQSCIYIQDIKPEEFLGFLRFVFPFKAKEYGSELTVLNRSCSIVQWLFQFPVSSFQLLQLLHYASNSDTSAPSLNHCFILKGMEHDLKLE